MLGIPAGQSFRFLKAAYIVGTLAKGTFGAKSIATRAIVPIGRIGFLVFDVVLHHVYSDGMKGRKLI